MKNQPRRLHLAALILLFAANASAQSGQKPGEAAPPPPPAAEYSPKEWKEYSSAEGGFSVRLVGTLRQESRVIETASGKVTLHLFGSETGAGVYMIAYLELPRTPEDPAGIRRALDAGRDQMLGEGKNRRLVGEEEISVEGHIAREVRFEDGALFYRNRSFMAAGRLYQVVLGAPLNVAFNNGRPSNDPKDWTDLYQSMCDRFFGSFRLLPATPPGGAVTSLPYGDPITHGGGADDGPKAQLSAGVLNGRAVKMPAPAYPPIAKATGVSGEVSVRVVFDESGRVIWARAVSGHEYLRRAAEEAARQATFPPTTVQGKPVKVSGVLIYRFTR